MERDWFPELAFCYRTQR